MHDLDDDDGLGSELVEMRDRLRMAPLDPKLNFQVGHLLYRLQRFAEAQQHLQKVVAADPTDAAAWSALGLAAAGAEAVPVAEQALRRAIELGHGDGITRAALASVLDHLHQPELAIQEGQQALAAELPPYMRGWLHGILGRNFGKIGDLEAAFTHLLQAVDANPEDAAAQHNLGVAYVYRGSYRAAVPHLQKAALLLGNHSGAWFDLGRAAREADAMETARMAFEKAIALGRDDGDVHLEIALVLQQLGIPEAALFHFQEAVKADPEDAVAHYNLGVAYWERDDFGAAIPPLERAVALAPEVTQYRLTLARAYAAVEEYGRVERLLRALLGSDQHEVAHLELVGSSIKQGRFEEALQLARAEIDKHPESAVAWAAHGWALAAAGDAQGAKSAWKKAQELDPGNAWVDWAISEGRENQAPE
jgi:tetratricopeptide (TPR) repeat protein